MFHKVVDNLVCGTHSNLVIHCQSAMPFLGVREGCLTLLVTLYLLKEHASDFINPFHVLFAINCHTELSFKPEIAVHIREV